jgi:hypothetical protein
MTGATTGATGGRIGRVDRPTIQSVTTEEDSGVLGAARPAQLKGHMHFSSEPRRDGYRPIVEPLWAWAQTVGIPQRQQSLLVLSAARRLDTGHLQVERVRDGIDSLPSLSSPAGREQLYEVLGDAEIALIALNRAITMAAKLSGLYRLPVSFPKIVSEKRSLLDNLRDAYEHVDDRALDRIHGKAAGEEAMLGFRSFSVLIEERRFTDGNDTLGLDEEMTRLVIATRDYLVKSWAELVARANRAIRGES